MCCTSWSCYLMCYWIQASRSLQEAANQEESRKFNFTSDFFVLFSFFISALFLSLILQYPVQILPQHNILFWSFHQFCKKGIWQEIRTSKKPHFLVDFDVGGLSQVNNLKLNMLSHMGNFWVLRSTKFIDAIVLELF